MFDKEDRTRGKKLTKQRNKINESQASQNSQKGGGLKNSLDMLRNGLEALRDRYKSKKERAMRGTDERGGERESDDSLQ